MGNVLTAIAGYLLSAAQYGYDLVSFLAMLIGMTFVVGGACALNNYLDRDIDSKMERTKKRPSVSGEMSPIGMQIYAWTLLVVGVGVLYLWTNLLVVGIGVIGFITYVWLYGAWSKRTSIHGTAVGAISGALPIAGGYAAASGMFDVGLGIAFLILFFWQFPEFFSIAIYRKKEYAAAGIPLMSIVEGVRSTTVQIVVFTIAYVIATLTLSFFGYTGIVYLLVMLASGIYWIHYGFKGLRTKNSETWSRSMFRLSMYNILLLCLMLSIGPLLP